MGDPYEEEEGSEVEFPLLPPRINYGRVGPLLLNDSHHRFFSHLNFTPSASNLLLLIFLMLFALSVLLLNSLLLHVLVRTHRPHPPSKRGVGGVGGLYLGSLAVMDGLLGLVVLPFMSIVALIGYFPFGRTACGVLVFADYYLILASSIGNTALMANYLWMIGWPESFPSSPTPHLLFIGLVWVGVTACWTPPFIHDRLWVNYPSGVCGFSIHNNKYFAVYVGVVGLYLPLGISLVCGIMTLDTLRRTRDMNAVIPTRGGEVGGGNSCCYCCNCWEGWPMIREDVVYISHNTSVDGGGGCCPHYRNPRRRERGSRRLMEARDQYPLIAASMVLFTLSRALFYLYFGMDSFVEEWLPLDVSTGVYWVMHSNAALAPLLHLTFDPRLKHQLCLLFPQTPRPTLLQGKTPHPSQPQVRIFF